MKKCVILVTNKPYVDKCISTVNQLLNIGKYNDDIVILIGDDLIDYNFSFNNEKIIIKHFPEIDRSGVLSLLTNKPIGDGRVFTKQFQWHKVHCFDVYFKQWDVCFYIDSGMYIFNEINSFFELDWKNSLLAHSDSYPQYEWTLNIQFDSNYFNDLYSELNNTYNMNIDYFQSGILLYDTNIINNETKNDIIKLSEKFINSVTNEQGIMNLYFNVIKNIWKQVDIKIGEKYGYDYWERDHNHHTNYLMLKYPKTL